MTYCITQTESEQRAEEEKNRKFLQSSIEASTNQAMKYASTDDQTLMSLQSEAEARNFWEHSPKAREEFIKFEIFDAYWKALRDGRTSIFSHNRK